MDKVNSVCVEILRERERGRGRGRGIMCKTVHHSMDNVVLSCMTDNVGIHNSLISQYSLVVEENSLPLYPAILHIISSQLLSLSILTSCALNLYRQKSCLS